MLFNIDLKATTAKELIIKLRKNKNGVAILNLDIENKHLIFGQLKCNEQVVDLLNQGLLLTTRIGALESIPTWDEVF